MNDGYFGNPFAREDRTVSTTVITLTEATYAPADGTEPRSARVTVEAQPIRYTLDGTDPNNGSTPPVGDIFTASLNTVIPLWGKEAIQKFKAIRSGGTDATLHVTYNR